MNEQELRREILRLTMLLADEQEKHRKELKEHNDRVAYAEMLLNKAINNITDAMTTLDQIRSAP